MKNRTGRYAALLTMSGVATGVVLLGPGVAMAQAAEPTVAAPIAGTAEAAGIQDPWLTADWHGWDPNKGKWDHKKQHVIKKKEKATFERVTWYEKKDHHKKWDDKWDDKKGPGDDQNWSDDGPNWSDDSPNWSDDDPTWTGNDPTEDDADQANLVAWDPNRDKWDHKKQHVIKKKEKATFERVTWFEKKHKKDHHKKWDDWSEQHDSSSNGPADDAEDVDLAG
ncbi:hypothetical protein ND748_07300 [Frankia sp. AiPs1]|uniref:hypothetical protein n=1 Tax=Frankia sp. AiPs1 TaxID=573493 RepID=UPI002042FBEF|nr:hypothetical protein [Frankia sp. AiPs1]MCM3921474.1 hypothetical protein [Frankia sp. AiPs1]